MNDDKKTRGELVAEIDELHKRLAVLEATQDADLLDALERARERLVSEREEALRALRDSEARYRLLAESTHDLVAEVDREGRLVFVSPSCEAVLGLRPEEMIGTTPFALLHPDDLERMAERFLARVGSGRAPGPGALFRVRHRDGSWRWLEGHGIDFATGAGETHVVAVSRDVTGRVEAERERERLEQRIQQARHFESLGMLATGVAHDFNNLLTPILGAAGLALMDLPGGSPLRRQLEKIQRAASEAAALTNQLLEYSGLGGLDPERVELAGLLAGLAEPLRGVAGARAELSLRPGAPGPEVDADRGQLTQLLANLVHNAADAVEARGAGAGGVRIGTGEAMLDEADVARLPFANECRPGRFAWLEVSDDGEGMEASTAGRIFDPFFTTRTTGRGLGLSVVLGVVRKHRGAVEVESARGRGTRIRIYLPVARHA